MLCSVPVFCAPGPGVGSAELCGTAVSVCLSQLLPGHCSGSERSGDAGGQTWQCSWDSCGSRAPGSVTPVRPQRCPCASLVLDDGLFSTRLL